MAGGRGTPFADLPPGSIHIATAGNGGRGGFPGLFQVSHKSQKSRQRQKSKESSKNFNFLQNQLQRAITLHFAPFLL